MKQIVLPLVSMSTGLRNAQSTLRKSKRAALLSEDKGRYHLFTAGSIAVGCAQGIRTLSALKTHPELKPIMIVSSPAGTLYKALPRAARRTDIVRGRTEGKEENKQAVRPNRAYVLKKVGARSAFLDVQSARKAEIFVAAPAAYYCDRPIRPHTFAPGQVSLGQICPRDLVYTIVAG
jgi:hypothetical protein